MSDTIQVYDSSEGNFDLQLMFNHIKLSEKNELDSMILAKYTSDKKKQGTLTVKDLVRSGSLELDFSCENIV